MTGMIGWFANSVGLMFARTAEKGAETIIWMASSPSIEGVSGILILSIYLSIEICTLSIFTTNKTKSNEDIRSTTKHHIFELS